MPIHVIHTNNIRVVIEELDETHIQRITNMKCSHVHKVHVMYESNLFYQMVYQSALLMLGSFKHMVGLCHP